MKNEYCVNSTTKKNYKTITSKVDIFNARKAKFEEK